MKAKILTLLEGITNNIENLESSKLHAQYLADELKISRNLVSQYLNEFVLEKKVIKTMTRPVFFYAKKVLEDKYHCVLEKEVYESIEDLNMNLKDSKPARDFEKLIGYNDSLRHGVEQCKAAMSYPPNGLPILINGPTGTGKSMIASLMYEYAVNMGIVKEDKKFVTMNCSEYANNPELLSANLFGSVKGAYTGADKDNLGLLNIAKDGILFLDEVHCLKAECQEKLFLFMDKGIYHMMGDNETWYESKVRIIFATTEKPEDSLLRTLLRRIPIIVKIPSLEERGLIEKKQLVYHLFYDESKQIDRTIYISNLVYQTLMNTLYPGNIGGIKNVIKAACANAFLNHGDRDNKTLNIHMYDLGDDIIHQSPIMYVKSQESKDSLLIEITNIQGKVNYRSQLIVLYKTILERFGEVKDNTISYSAFIQDCGVLVDNYNDHIMFNQQTLNTPALEFTRKIVDKIFSIVINRYGMKISNNDIMAYSKYLYEYTRASGEVRLWMHEHAVEVEELLSLGEQRMSREFYIAQEIIENIDVNLDIDLDRMAQLTLMLNLRIYNRDFESSDTVGIILSHGYSTASSIADAANKLLGQYIFDALDMQLDMSVDKVVEQLTDYLKRRSGYQELVLMVDMGSLEEIYKGISHVATCNIGIINNITTKLALEVGEGIRSKRDVAEILETASQHNHYTYRYINNRKRKNVILSVCATGLGAAEKIMGLLKNSLPYDIPVEIVSYDYKALSENGLKDAIFSRYQVMAIIGTLNPRVDEMPFIAIEELVMNDNIDILRSLFSQFLDEEGLHKFNANIVKNFSLDNILNHLTILNAQKVLEDVEYVVVELEKRIQRKLSAVVKVGLYVHLSCLIERLITHSEIGVYEDIEEFEEKHGDFIKIMVKCFEIIQKRYSVEIPSTEVAYIYNYIQIDQ